MEHSWNIYGTLFSGHFQDKTGTKFDTNLTPRNEYSWQKMEEILNKPGRFLVQ